MGSDPNSAQKDLEELDTVKRGFDEKSTKQAISGCVRALAGF